MAGQVGPVGRRARGALPPAAAWGAVVSAVLLPLLVLALLGPVSAFPSADVPGAAALPTQAEGEQGSVQPASASPRSPTPTPSPADGEQGSGRPASAGPRSPAPSPTPTVVQRGDGRLAVVRGTSAVTGTGPLRRYRVEVEGRLGLDPMAYARAVEAILRDPRSWTAGGRRSFQRVDSGRVDVRVVLASPQTTDRLCRPLDTAGRYSCANGGMAVINSMRWLKGAPAYGDDLAGYRRYVVNHEVGHVLGRGHQQCRKAGALAPVMMQQTKGVGACRPNPWPYP